MGYDFKRQRIVKKIVAEKVVRPWPDRRLRPCARSPISVVHCVDGMTSVDVEALRRRRREPTSAVRWRISARYDGAVPIRQ